MEPTPNTGPGEAEAKLTFDPTSIGTSGLRAYGGYVVEEFLPELRGERGAKVFREMSDNDPIVGAVIFAVTMLIRQVKWSVQSAGDTPEDEEAKEFVESIMGDMSTSWSTVISEVCTMFVYGFAPLEIVWKRRMGPKQADGSKRSQYNDGRIGIRALALRAQNTIPKWVIDSNDGSLDGLVQQPPSGSPVFIPIHKLLLFRTTEAKQNPEGRSLLRTAYRPWFFKKRIEEIEAIGTERDLAGLPVVRIPAKYMSQNGDPSDAIMMEQYKKLVTNIRRDKQEGVILPSTRDAAGHYAFDLTLLSTGGSRQFDTTKIVDRYNKAIATSVLADFILLGQGSTGSFALSSNKTDVFATAIGAFLGSIVDVFNRHLIPRLWELNGFTNKPPKLTTGDLDEPDLNVLGQFITSLTGAGLQMFPDRELENRLREMAGLPLAPEEGEENGEGFDEPMPPNDGADAEGVLADE